MKVKMLNGRLDNYNVIFKCVLGTDHLISGGVGVAGFTGVTKQNVFNEVNKK